MAKGYLVSRRFRMPESADGMAQGYWFNMWAKRLWPFRDLQAGDRLFWLESPSRVVTWASRVQRVERFAYQNKPEACRLMEAAFGSLDRQQPYFVDAPDEGVCIAWNVEGSHRLHLARPPAFRMPRLGWAKLDETRAEWPELATAMRSIA